MFEWIGMSCHIGLTSSWVDYGFDEGMRRTGIMDLDPSKPFFFSEFGASPKWDQQDYPSFNQRKEWLRDAFDYMVSNDRVKAFMYYDYDDFSRITSDSAVLDPWREKVSSNPAFLATGGVSPIPSPSPTPTPTPYPQLIPTPPPELPLYILGSAIVGFAALKLYFDKKKKRSGRKN